VKEGRNLAQNFMASETHLFTPLLINEFRFGFNEGKFGFYQENANVPADQLVPGMGGVPFAGYPEPNGGLPWIVTSRGNLPISAAGARHDVPSIEHQNVYQILDNVTKVRGSHSLKFGVQLESIRTSFAQAEYPRGSYWFSSARWQAKAIWLVLQGPGRVAVQSVFERPETVGSVVNSSGSTTQYW